LARIDAIERHEPRVAVGHDGFLIAASAGGIVATSIVPDAATCAACVAEIGSPGERRFRYPFTNCTQCRSRDHAAGPWAGRP
jgi:hydrogenase maturation protein HypF